VSYMFKAALVSW